MSVKVSTWVWHDDATRELKIGQMLVLLALADIANDDGDVVFVSDKKRDGEQAALARKARMSVASFRRITHELADLGLLSIERDTQTSPNRYRVMTAQSERSQVSGQMSSDERSHRSPVSGHTSLIRTDVTTDVGAPQKRGTRIPQPFVVTEEMVIWAKQHAPLVPGQRSTERFVNYFLAAPGQKGVKLDWKRTWQNWLLKDQEDAERRAPAKLTPSQRAQQTLALADEQLAVGA